MNKRRFLPFISLFHREVRRFFRVIYQTIATPLVASLLYILIFGVSLGREIEPIDHFTYLAYLIPGLVMMGSLRNAFDNASGSIVVSRFCGELEDLRTVPLSITQILWAHGLASTLRGFIVAGITLLIGQLFYYVEMGQGWLAIEHPFIVLFYLFLGGMAFAHLGIAISMICKNFEQVSAINTFILLPLIYLGGIFFSLQQLSPFWRELSLYNPLLYMVNGVRLGMLGVGDVSSESCLFVSLFTVVLFYIAAFISLKRGSYSRW